MSLVTKEHFLGWHLIDCTSAKDDGNMPDMLLIPRLSYCSQLDDALGVSVILLVGHCTQHLLIKNNIYIFN